jgi:putative transposase
VLTVVHDANGSNDNAGASRSLLDEIVRDGARQMLHAALKAVTGPHELVQVVCASSIF